MIGLLRRLSRWPLWLLHALGGWLGWLTYAASTSYRSRLRANAAAAGVSAADRRASIAEAGRLVAELPRLWLRPPEEPIADPVHWDGREVLQALLARGRGLVLLTPHLGSFEVSAQAYAQEFGQQQPITVLYRPARKQLLRELEETARARPALATAPATLAGVRQMLRALKKGQTVGLLPDQVPPEGMGVWVPFFGQNAYTMTLAARLVQQTGAAVGLLWTERLPGGRGYLVHASELPEPLPEGADDETAARVINRAMESVILRCPRQYLWGYHRYKSPRRPEAA
ncbi:MAG TPA: lysophospholipid acyltransferase family protein [Rubrivivax sp.]|nr:lysophospholipid acyltransferase family protein [Rubrivivax sp.]